MDGWVSVGRIQKFLELPEINATHRAQTSRESAMEGASQARVKVTNASFTWLASATEVQSNRQSLDDAESDVENSPGLESKAGLLQNVTLSVDAGTSPLVLIFGSTGSYKSSLLEAILGEMPRVRGGLECVGSVAYVQQVPFIIDGSLRTNILFGKKFDRTLYDATLKACCLLEDLLQLPAGDLTMIGERGINLSGGQKMRVCLARAVYADADIYLIDDALAAVDVHVGQRLFYDVLIGMLSDKLRLVVMNQIHYAQYADRIILMGNPSEDDEGKISTAETVSDTQTPKLEPKRHNHYGWVEEVGTYQQLMSSGSSRLPGMLEAYQRNSDIVATEQQSSSADTKLSKKTESQQAPQNEPSISLGKKQVESRVGRTLHTKEDRQRGRIKLRVFCRYAKAMGVWMWIFVLTLFLMAESLRVSVDFFLAAWSSESHSHVQSLHNWTTTGQGTRHVFTNMHANHVLNDNSTAGIASGAYANKTAAYMRTYVALTAGAVVVTGLRTFLLILTAIRAAHMMYV